MAFKTKVVFNILLIFCTITIVNVLRNALPISNDTKVFLSYPHESLLNFTETCVRHGYNSEEHTVTTEDGYILMIFRIYRNKCVLRRPPVLLMHGFLQSADVFLDPGPSAGLPYLLADKCFDVWVGNQRGNYYARRHKKLNPDKDPLFWDFEVDEIALFDIPATIDYILKYSRAPKLNYVGFSNGSGTFFIMCSEKPGYCKKVKLHIGLATAARLTNTRSEMFKGLFIWIKRLQSVLSSLGYNEILAKGAIEQEFLFFTCLFTINSEKICGRVIYLFDSFHPRSIANDTLFNIFGHFPAGTSLRTFVRYAQSFTSSRFEKFDYGQQNLKIYGSKEPPSYNLSAVTVPTVILYGKNDNLVDMKDLHWLVKRLPNVLEIVEIKDTLWNHFDFIYSRHIPKMVYPILYKYLLMYSK